MFAVSSPVDGRERTLGATARSTDLTRKNVSAPQFKVKRADISKQSDSADCESRGLETSRVFLRHALCAVNARRTKNSRVLFDRYCKHERERQPSTPRICGEIAAPSGSYEGSFRRTRALAAVPALHGSGDRGNRQARLVQDQACLTQSYLKCLGFIPSQESVFQFVGKCILHSESSKKSCRAVFQIEMRRHAAPSDLHD